VGGGANGAVQTAGAKFNNAALTTINAAACGGANGADATAAGLCASATSAGSTALGSNSKATSADTTAVGFRSVASFTGSVAIGYQAQATADPTTAVGSNSLASGNNSVALGAGASATANNSVALGANSLADRANSVSVGSVGSERQITNVAAGVNATDAVNVGQLNSSVSSLQNQISNNNKHAMGGVAAALAAAGLRYDERPGKFSAAAGVSYYGGQSALAMGVGGTLGNGLWRVNGGLTVVPTLSKPDVGVAIGVSRTLN
jgi:autotransporter adhesin